MLFSTKEEIMKFKKVISENRTIHILEEAVISPWRGIWVKTICGRWVKPTEFIPDSQDVAPICYFCQWESVEEKKEDG